MKRERSKKKTYSLLTLAALAVELSRLSAYATEFEPLGKAVAASLGTKSAFKKSFAFEGKPLDVFYSKGFCISSECICVENISYCKKILQKCLKELIVMQLLIKFDKIAEFAEK